jgi:phytoene dehydrogenase-like protein
MNECLFSATFVQQLAQNATREQRVTMGWTAQQHREKRALHADPYPKPRGKAPFDERGVPKKWDKENGGWQDVVQSEVPSSVFAAWPTTLLPALAVNGLPIAVALPVAASLQTNSLASQLAAQLEEFDALKQKTEILRQELADRVARGSDATGDATSFPRLKKWRFVLADTERSWVYLVGFIYNDPRYDSEGVQVQSRVPFEQQGLAAVGEAVTSCSGTRYLLGAPASYAFLAKELHRYQRQGTT